MGCFKSREEELKGPGVTGRLEMGKAGVSVSVMSGLSTSSGIRGKETVENIVDWPAIVRRYRILKGQYDPDMEGVDKNEKTSSADIHSVPVH